MGDARRAACFLRTGREPAVERISQLCGSPPPWPTAEKVCLLGSISGNGFRGQVARSTLPDARETRDSHIFAAFVQTLIATPPPMYAAPNPFHVQPHRIRSNLVHIGSVQARPRVAAILSVVETRRRPEIPVRLYLGDVLPGLADRKPSGKAALTPLALKLHRQG